MFYFKYYQSLLKLELKLENQPINKYEITLVDHHELDPSQTFLSKFVTEIYDHHDDKDYDYKSNYPNLLVLNCQYPRSSALNIVIEHIMETDEMNTHLNQILKDHNIDFLISPLLLDSKGLKKNLKNSKWVKEDSDLLEKIYNISKSSILLSKEEHVEDLHELTKLIYKKLKGMKYDVEKNLSLGYVSLFNKDRKDYEIIQKTKDKLIFIFISLQIDLADIKNKFGEKVIEEFIKTTNPKPDGLCIIFTDVENDIKTCHFYSETNKFFDEKTFNKFTEGLINKNKEGLGEYEVKIINSKEFSFKAHKNLNRKIVWPEIKSFFENI